MVAIPAGPARMGSRAGTFELMMGERDDWPRPRYPASDGLRSNHGRALSRCAARRKNLASSPYRPTSCTTTGIPSPAVLGATLRRPVRGARRVFRRVTQPCSASGKRSVNYGAAAGSGRHGSSCGAYSTAAFRNRSGT